MFSLAERLGSHTGAYCGVEGLYLGPSALIELHDGIYRVRPPEEIAVLVAAAYSSPPDTAKLMSRLQAIAGDLQRNAVGQAMVSAVLLGFGKLSDDGIGGLTEAEALLKYNFNPLEPRNRIGWWEHDGEASPIIPVRAERPGPPAPAHTPRTPPAWESQPNADFRNRLAMAEGNGDKPDYGYGEVNRETGALGRYQMTPVALRAIGMLDGSSNWTGKYDIHSRAEFLADPEAQEKALTDYLDDTARQLKANGAYSFIGTSVDGVHARFTITRAGC